MFHANMLKKYTERKLGEQSSNEVLGAVVVQDVGEVEVDRHRIFSRAERDFQRRQCKSRIVS